MFSFSLGRFFAIVQKEFILMKRDPAVLIIMAILPLVIVILTGLTVNINPKNVPAVLVNYSPSPITARYIAALKNTGYFKFIRNTKSRKEAQRLMQRNYARFILTIPANFTQKLIRHQKPTMLLEGDGTDLIGTGPAFTAAYSLNLTQLDRIMPSSLAYFAVAT